MRNNTVVKHFSMKTWLSCEHSSVALAGRGLSPGPLLLGMNEGSYSKGARAGGVGVHRDHAEEGAQTALTEHCHL